MPRSPLLRWVGGKARLVHLLRKAIPPFDAGAIYYEPFCGAASLFFAVRPRKAVLGDMNPALVNCLSAIKTSPEHVWRCLRPMTKRQSQKAYYEARAKFNGRSASFPQAALFLYLNRCCFNGIWRVNKCGEFNVPYGGKARPGFPRLEDLRFYSVCLQHTKLVSADFAVTAEKAQQGDFVYLDPPYPPLNGTAYFTHYTKERFPPSEQERLATLCRVLDSRGCKFLVSNADLPKIRELYAGFKMIPIATQRWVAAHGRRFRVQELAITNYEWKRS